MRDPYEVLGVPRSANAAAIKSAYRKLAKKYHPDANKNDPKAAARFAELNTANEIISDADKRKQFDRGEIDAEGKPRFQGFPGGDPRARAGGFETHTFRTGPGAGAGFGGGGGFEDILNSMFGAAAARGGRAGGGGGTRFEFDPGTMAMDLDLSVAMTVSLEEAMRGADKRVRLPTGKELNVKISAGCCRRSADSAERAGRNRARPSARRSPDHDQCCAALVLQGRGQRSAARIADHAL